MIDISVWKELDSSAFIQDRINNSSRRSPKNPEQHLKHSIEEFQDFKKKNIADLKEPKCQSICNKCLDDPQNVVFFLYSVD